MPDTSSGSRGRGEQKIPRIGRTEASRILARVERLLESADLINALRGGFQDFLAQLDEAILQLAIQPDSWGERTRARLVAALMTQLKGIPAAAANPDEIAETANIVIPCFLLELGRRRQHIGIEFPQNPCAADCNFQIALEPSQRKQMLSVSDLAHLVAAAGEELVGLCYFGDIRSRTFIEAVISGESSDPKSGRRKCRSWAPPKSEN